MPSSTLRVVGTRVAARIRKDVERPGGCSHAEHGDDSPQVASQSMFNAHSIMLGTGRVTYGMLRSSRTRRRKPCNQSCAPWSRQPAPFQFSDWAFLLIAWLLRRDEPDRWRRMSARRTFNMVLGIIAIGFTTFLFGLVLDGEGDPADLALLHLHPTISRSSGHGHLLGSPQARSRCGMSGRSRDLTERSAGSRPARASRWA